MARIVVLSRRGIRHPLSGGAGRYVHEVFSRLTDRHSITVLSGGLKGRKPVEEIDGITYRYFPDSFHRILLPVRYIGRYAGKTDLLIDNSDVGMPWLSPLYVKKPRIVIIHQLVREIFYDQLPRPISDIGFRIEPLMYRVYSNSRVVAASDSTANDLVQYGVRRKNIDVIEPGCWNLGFHRKELTERSPFTIGCVSRLMKYKGLQLAFRALDRVKRQSPEVRLLIAGAGPYQRDLIRMAVRLGISENVTFMGRISEESKFKLYSESRIAISPSVREGFGISVIEANSVGTPVVAWNVPGLRDSVVDNETGFLVPFPDERAFAKEILTLLDNDEVWNRFSENALKWSAIYSWDRASKKFDRVIDEVLDGKRTSNSRST